MTILRIIGGIVSIVLAIVFAFGAVYGLCDQIAEDRRQKAGLQFSFVRVGGIALEGWQIYAFFVVLALLAVGFAVVAYYAFSQTEAA